MALIVMLLVPAVVGAWLVAGGRSMSVHTQRWVTLGAAATTLVAAAVTAWLRPDVNRVWLVDLGVHWHFGVDGISIPLVLLTASVGLLLAVHAFGDLPRGGASSTLLGCLLLVEAGALATFTARDAIMFFLAFELVLVPMFVLISRFGDAHHPKARAEAGYRFILYTALGSSLMLVGILLLVTSAGTSDFEALVAQGAALPPGRQLTIALLLTLGLAVKIPLFPLHTWLPSAHTMAPTAGSVLLAGVLLKMGTYGLIRLPLAAVPDGFAQIAPWLAIPAVIGIVWGGLICLVERDLKRLIAYSSVAHMGFVVLGLSARNELGLQAALLGNIAHGVISALLFVLVGGLKQRWGRVDLSTLRPALREVAPHRGFLLMVGIAASLGLPGLAGFWGEFLAIAAAWSPADPHQVGVLRTCAVIAAVGAVLAAAYGLRVAGRVWSGDAVPAPTPEESETPGVQDIETRGSERLVATALAVAVIALGVLPHLIVDISAPAVRALLGGGQ